MDLTKSRGLIYIVGLAAGALALLPKSFAEI